MARPRPDEPPRDTAPTCVVDAVRRVTDDAPSVAAAHDALVAIALTLAWKLDEGAGMATAAVASELRATLDQILPEVEADDELDGFLAGLRSPVDNQTKP